MLNIRDKDQCKYDFISLGEVLLRFDPGDERIHTARNFRVWEGGGEYNVARGLRKTFGLRTGIVTALADNRIGRLVEDLIFQGGVDSDEIVWRETDGLSRESRNGIYFMERGFGLRSPVGCSDRGNTAVAKLGKSDIDWDDLFNNKGSCWFHTGGIFAGLSETTPEVILEAVEAARQNKTIVSFDLNYRDSLWRHRGGRDASDLLNSQILPFVDVVFGCEKFDSRLAEYDDDKFHDAAKAMLSKYPNLKVIATTLRDVTSSSSHNLGGVCFRDGEIIRSRKFRNVEVLDRVGTGDAFAAGVIYGVLMNKSISISLDFGVINSALALTTVGDSGCATLEEIEGIRQNTQSSLSR